LAGRPRHAYVVDVDVCTRCRLGTVAYDEVLDQEFGWGLAVRNQEFGWGLAVRNDDFGLSVQIHGPER